jgi:hypothetical protein
MCIIHLFVCRHVYMYVYIVVRTQSRMRYMHPRRARTRTRAPGKSQTHCSRPPARFERGQLRAPPPPQPPPLSTAPRAPRSMHAVDLRAPTARQPKENERKGAQPGVTAPRWCTRSVVTRKWSNGARRPHTLRAARPQSASGRRRPRITRAWRLSSSKRSLASPQHTPPPLFLYLSPLSLKYISFHQGTWRSR